VRIKTVSISPRRPDQPCPSGSAPQEYLFFAGGYQQSSESLPPAGCGARQNSLPQESGRAAARNRRYRPGLVQSCQYLPDRFLPQATRPGRYGPVYFENARADSSRQPSWFRVTGWTVLHPGEESAITTPVKERLPPGDKGVYGHHLFRNLPADRLEFFFIIPRIIVVHGTFSEDLYHMQHFSHHWRVHDGLFG